MDIVWCFIAYLPIHPVGMVGRGCGTNNRGGPKILAMALPLVVEVGIINQNSGAYVLGTALISS